MLNSNQERENTIIDHQNHENQEWISGRLQSTSPIFYHILPTKMRTNTGYKLSDEKLTFSSKNVCISCVIYITIHSPQ
jgi:hypothetical protein